MTRRVSVARAAAAAKSTADQIVDSLKSTRAKSSDSFQNFGLNLGMGTDNALADSSYGFNPITRQRMLLEWIHRGSWLGGVAVDLVADDMTRAGVQFGSELKPEDGERLDAAAVQLAVWEAINDAIKWGRLYGGAIAVMQIEGQKEETPLRVKTVGKGQFRGLYVFDRWMVEPSLSDLVTEKGPHLGLPKFYRVSADAPAFSNAKIHYSRCIRLEGTRLPWNQRIAEQYWGLSVYERLYDRMIAFDSATQGAAQLVYRSSFRTLKVNQLRELIGGDTEAAMILGRYVEMARRFQGIEGITLIDSNDDLVTQSMGNFSGISDALIQFAQQLAGALQIPVVRLFGQSPAGMNATGESDIVTYYDGIKHQQERWLKTSVERIYQCIAGSEGITLPDNFSVNFRPLWQITDEKKGAIAASSTSAIVSAYDSGVVGRATALKELRQLGSTLGIWTNIGNEEVEQAEDEPAPAPEGMERDPDGKLVPGGSMGPDGQPLPLGEDGRPVPPAPAPGAEPDAGGQQQDAPARKPYAPRAGAHVHVHAGDSSADLPDDVVKSIAQQMDAYEDKLIKQALARRRK